MSHIVEIRMPRQVTITLGKLDDERLAEVKQILAEAEKRGQGVIIAEHKRMKVVEIGGMTTGRIVAELRLVPTGDPVTTLAGYKSSPPEGITVLGMIPAGMLAKASVVTLESQPTTAT